MLENKKILIFISGSIAAYKSLLLIRLFVKSGASVRVIATTEALKFITPLSIEALSQTKLLSDGLESWDTTSHNAPTPNHIEYAKWADIAIFAPITANSINKLANGIADNIYLSSALALPNIPRLLAPSANTRMLENAITKDNLSRLRSYGYEVIDSRSDLLACGEVGNGAMADISEIVFRTKRALYRSAFWSGRDVIITGGGSSENIDSVRCITNHSSGLQACNLALALYYLGANVSLITSKQPIELPRDIAVIRVNSSREYLSAIESCVGSCDYESLHLQYDSNKSQHSSHLNIRHASCYSEASAEETHSPCHFKTSAKDSHRLEKPQKASNPHNHKKAFLFMAAAISDYIPQTQEGKLKKKDIGEVWNLKLHENIDILKSINAKNLIKIAFKAECDRENAKKHAIATLDSKNCHAVCLNIISDSNKAFSSDDNQITCISRVNSSDKIDSQINTTKDLEFCEKTLKGSKLEVSFGICEFLAQLFRVKEEL